MIIGCPATTGARPGLPGLGLSLVVLLLAGCATNNNVAGASYSSRSDADARFADGVNQPPTAQTLYGMGRLLAAQGKDGECEFVLRRIIHDFPRYTPTYCDLAELLLRHRRVEDAIQVVSAGLRVAPRDPILLNNLGMCRMLNADYDEALNGFTEAAAIMPQNARYRANMAASLGMLGRYEESLALYEQVVPGAEAHFNLGVLCEARGDTARSLEEYRRAQDLGLELTRSETGGRLEVDQ